MKEEEIITGNKLMGKAKKFIIEYYKEKEDLTEYINNPFWTDNARRMEEYKDQELSELTEKYNKLKEAFENILQSSADRRYNILYELKERQDFKNKWLIKAGLKQK